MASSIGYKLNNPALITGFGLRCRIHHHVGTGVGRRAAGSVISAVGHAFMNKLASAISGSGYKKRVVHSRLGLGWKLTGAGEGEGVHRRRRIHHCKPRILIGAGRKQKSYT